MLGAAAACSGGGSNLGANRDGGSSQGDASSGGGDGGVFMAGDDGGGVCTGIACGVAQCDGGQTTTVRGTVYDPAGKVPLYNVVVYVPNAPLEPLASNGATCDQCGGTISGSPIVTALTDAAGSFVLKNVPVGSNVPLVMQLGKWRREVTLPSVPACTETVVTDRNLTRLPRNASEGSIPRIALTTGGADPLECLLRKVGLDETEFSTAGGTGHVQLYSGGGWTETTSDGGVVNHPPTSAFAPPGGAFADASTLWGSAQALKAYDIVLMACEGDPSETKPPATLQALYDYENAGGRVFASHYHRFWFVDGPSPVPSVGSWLDQPSPAPPSPAVADGTVDTSFPKGQAFRDWLVNVGASTTPGLLPIKDSKDNVYAANASEAQQWISMPNPNAISDAGGRNAVEYMTFNTPIAQPASAQCGRVVYSDLHVSSGDVTGEPFPTGCITTDLSPQEKALEFMLFDLSSCVQSDSMPPVAPR
jgi:hypothetical protein